MLEHLNRFVQYEFFENYGETVDILTASIICLVLNVDILTASIICLVLNVDILTGSPAVIV
jgi:hypothetical protein